MPKIYLCMPDNSEFSGIRIVVEEACNKIGLEVFAGDDSSVWSWQNQLENSSFVIADITMTGDVDVFFEIGYAWRTQKTVLVIGQQSATIGAMGNHGVLVYNPNDLENFRNNLIAELVALCIKQRIRYAKFVDMPEKTDQTPIPLLPEKSMRQENFVSIGDAYVDEKRYSEAYDEYSRAIDDMECEEPQSHHSYTYFKRAYLCKIMRKTDQALADYNIAIKVNPQYVDAYFARGRTLYELKRYDDAHEDFSKAAALKPDFTKAYVYAGLMQRLMRNHMEAISILNKAIELSPKYQETYFHRGQVYVDIKDYEKALQDFSRAINLDKGYIDAFIQRGLVYMGLKNYDPAIKDFNDVIQLDSSNVDAYSYRGQALYEKGYREFHSQAIADWQKAIELGASDFQDLEAKIKSTSRNL